MLRRLFSRFILLTLGAAGFLFLSSFSALGQDKISVSHNLRAYYFPLEKLTKPKVYVFEDRFDPETRDYWVLQLKVEGQDSTLVTEFWSHQGGRAGQIRETVTSRGMIASEFTKVVTDTNGQSRPLTYQIDSNQVFNWHADAEQPFVMAATFKDSLLESAVILIRKFTGEISNRQILGQEKPCATYETSYFYKEAYPEEEESIGNHKETYYFAKGIGIVGYRYRYADRGKRVIMELKEIMSKKKFLKLQEKGEIVWKEALPK